METQALPLLPAASKRRSNVAESVAATLLNAAIAR